MTISFRTKLDFSVLDAKAERRAAGAPYVKPSAIRSWRLERRLSMARAAALAGFKHTWWSFRESGHQIMDLAQFEAIQRAAPPLPMPGQRRMTLAKQVAALEARVAALEDQLRPSRKLL